MMNTKKIGILCLLIFLYLFFYHATLDDYFFFEDFTYLERSKIHSLEDIPALFSVELSKRGFGKDLWFYRPLSSNLYFGLLQLFFGLNHFYFHAANLLILGLNAFLFYRLLGLLGVRPPVSVLFSFLYSISSVNFKSQLYLSVGQDLICINLILLSLNSYISSENNDNRRMYYLSILFFFLSLLSKEMAFSLPLVLFTYNGIVRRHKLIANLKELAPFALLAILFVLWRVLFFGIPPSDGAYGTKIGWFLFGSLMKYVSWTVEAIFLYDGMAVITVLVIAGGLLFSLADAKRRLLFLFGCSWFLIALLPVIFLPYRQRPYYLVLPILGALISLSALADCLWDYTKSKKASAPLVIILISIFYIFSYRNFALKATKTGESRNQNKSLIEQLRTRHPHVADNTVFHFYFPTKFPPRNLMKDSGAAIRIVYDNPTLEATEIKQADLKTIDQSRNGQDLFFAWMADDKLLDLTHNLPPSKAPTSKLVPEP